MSIGPRILFIGTTTADVIADVRHLRKITIEGEASPMQLVGIAFASKTELHDLQIRPGGSAANSAVAATQLGARCALLTALGGDLLGRHLLQNLRRHRVDASAVQVFKRDKTAVSIILLSEGEKSVLVYKGAFRKLGPQHLSEERVEKNDAVVATALSSEENFHLFVKAVQLAHKHRKKIVFAPSMTMLKARRKEFENFRERFDLCIMNEEEACFLTGRKSASSAIKALPGRVKVVTCAGEGALAYANGELLRIGAPKVRIVDTTGAGDAFTGAFVHEFYSHGDLREAMRTATAVAALKLGHLGAHFTKKPREVEAFKKSRAKELAVRKV